MILINIGGIVCEISCIDKRYNKYIEMLFKGFESEEEPNSIIQLDIVNSDNKLGEGIKYTTPRPQEVIDTKKEGSKILFSHSELIGDFDTKTKKGFFKIINKTFNERTIKIGQQLRELIRLIYGFMWIEKEKILVHGSTIVKEGKAVMFIGNPGEGKSTIAKIAKENNYIILSDEANLVHKNDSSVIVEGTPLGGELEPINQKANLMSVYFIKKAEKTKTTLLNRSEAIVELQKNIMSNMLLDLKEFKDSLIKSFMISADIFQNINFYRLENEKNEKFLEVIKF